MGYLIITMQNARNFFAGRLVPGWLVGLVGLLGIGWWLVQVGYWLEGWLALVGCGFLVWVDGIWLEV